MNHDLCARGSHVRCYCRLRLDTTPYDHYTGKWWLPRGKPFIGRRAVLMQDIPSGCSGGNESDARTHRTPKHSARNARETRVLFRVSFGSAQASPRRFARISDYVNESMPIICRICLLRTGLRTFLSHSPTIA